MRFFHGEKRALSIRVNLGFPTGCCSKHKNHHLWICSGNISLLCPESKKCQMLLWP